ncbi:MAG: glycosyltransferase 87 family protein [Bryobacteraceae bacterium]|jgi:Gpi18-like mannosyltransferase
MPVAKMKPSGAPNRATTVALPAASPVSDVSRGWKIAIVAAATCALVVKLFLALKTIGTNDVTTFHHFLVWWRYLGTVGLYRADSGFNHPPSMLYVLRLFGWLESSTSLPFAFWLRVPAILADAGSLWIVWQLLRPRLQERQIRWAVLLLAIAPPLILISGFHGNTDPVMILFLLWSIYLIEKGKSACVSGALFGCALCIKVVPVIAIPAVFLYQRNWRTRVQYFAAAAAVVLISWSPFIFHLNYAQNDPRSAWFV